MAAPYRRRVKQPSTHWNGEDGKTIKVIQQGQLLIVKTLKQPPEAPIGAKRGHVTEFSRQSRLRLLSTIAKLDWDRCKPTLFVTLTFPNRETPFTKIQLNSYRYLFHRRLELELGRKVPILWRIEWQNRKSGPHTGKPYPHFHLIVFGEKFLDHKWVNEAWKKTIGETEYTRTDTQGMANQRQAVFYVAKYMAKVDCSLVNDAYLNTVPSHRHWGIMRKNLLPFFTPIEIRLTPGEWFDKLKELAAFLWEDFDCSMESFRILGKNSEELAKAIWEEWRRQSHEG